MVLLLYSFTGSKQEATVGLYVKYTTALEIIWPHPLMHKKKLALLLLETVCKEKSLQLKLTDRLRDHVIGKYNYSKLKSQQRIRKDDVVRWEKLERQAPYLICRVLLSEFENEEQFERVCQDNVKQGLPGQQWMTSKGTLVKKPQLPVPTKSRTSSRLHVKQNAAQILAGHGHSSHCLACKPERQRSVQQPSEKVFKDKDRGTCTDRVINSKGMYNETI